MRTVSVGSEDGVPDGVSDGAMLGVKDGWPVGQMLTDGWLEG